MANEKPWRRVLAAFGAFGLLAMTLLIVSFPKSFERLYLKTAGELIGGVNGRLGFWIAAFVIVGVIGWVSVGVACFTQRTR
jgi:hypothetical protein